MQFIDLEQDTWQAADDALAVPAANLLLTSAQWRALRDAWPAELPVGLKLANDEDVEDIAAELPRFALVALHFPKWTDGRAYSQAHLLRARYRYAGEVRATGDVLVDMLPLLQRSGFDTVVLKAGQSIEAARRALGFFPAYYQGDVVQTQPIFGRATA
ncbi:MAG TPA: DUF934 domain-containing protein [Burkholderiaceae bacterium]